MKKYVLLVLALLLTCTTGVLAAPQLTLIVNGQKVNTNPQLINDSTFVPLRVVSEMLGAEVGWNGETYTVTVIGKENQQYDAVLTFPADRYPLTAAHIQQAIANGESAICTIDRAGADENRSESLKGIPTRDGHDRDEWPMAMCAEGGSGASVAYVELSDNRGAGSWVGNELTKYPDGTKVLFDIGSSATVEIASNAPAPTQSAEQKPFNSCAEAKAAGKAPVRKGDPGYSSKIDRDGDGIACE